MSTKLLTTYTSLTAGSCFYMPDGKCLRFMGKPGGHGTYTTSDPAEIAELDKLHDSPTAQISRTEVASVEISEKTGAVEKVLEVKEQSKPKEESADVAQAAADAAEASARVTSPAVAAAQAKLAGTIAGSKAA